MKKIIAALMLSGVFAMPAMAQRGGDHTPEERAKMRTERMAENLNLSGEQKEAVYAANLELAKTTDADRAEAMKANDAKMKEILTEEQYAQLKSRRKEFKRENPANVKFKDKSKSKN